MNAVITALVLWIAANSPYSVPDLTKLPEVKIVTQAEIDEIYFGHPVGEETDSQIKGLFYKDRNAIYTLKNPRKDYLLHELVHWFQAQNGEYEKVACLSALEVDAYRLQKKYSKEQGIAWEFDDFTIAMGSICY